MYLSIILYACQFLCLAREARGSEIERNDDQLNFTFTFVISNPSKKYFGYTIALVPYNATKKQAGILVGAPLANYLLPNSQEVQSGQVFYCTLKERMDVKMCDQKPEVHNKLCDKKQSLVQHSTCNNSFLGASLTATNEMVIACAPKWSRIRDVKNETMERMDGACYFFDNPVDPIRWKELKNKQDYLLPFGDTNFSLPDHGALKEGSFRWFYAQFGFSIHVSQTKKVLIGSPGVNRWSGGVVEYEYPNLAANAPWRILLSESLDAPYADLYTGYLGYAVTSGKYFSTKEEMIAASAPRAPGNSDAECKSAGFNTCLHGAVMIVSSDTLKSKDDVWNVNHTAGGWKPFVVIGGNQFGSYFGASLESVDINGDGLDDLIVGAPFHDGRHVAGGNDEASSGWVEDNGCIFIYSMKWNLTSGTEPKVWPVAQIICSGIPYGRFGSTIASFGDVDQDGFNDFAVGSPYEMNTGKKCGEDGGNAPDESLGIGSVYILFGRDDNMKLEQLRLCGKKYGFRSRGFGLSLVGNTDIDGNGSPDFAVGSYMDKSVVIFPTRPRLVLGGSLETVPKNLLIKANHTEFKITHEITTEVLPKQPRRRNVELTIEFTIKVDNLLHRYYIQDNAAKASSLTFNVTCKVSQSQKTSCSSRNFTTVKSSSADSFDDSDIPIEWEARYITPPYDSSDQTKFTYGDGRDIKKGFRDGDPTSNFLINNPYTTKKKLEVTHVQFINECLPLLIYQTEHPDLEVCQPELNVTLFQENKTKLEILLGEHRVAHLSMAIHNSNQTAYSLTVCVFWSWVQKTDGRTVTNMEQPTLMAERLPSCNHTLWGRCIYFKSLRKNETQLLELPFRLDGGVATSRDTALRVSSSLSLPDGSGFPNKTQDFNIIINVNASVNVSSSPTEWTLPFRSQVLRVIFEIRIGGVSPVLLKLFVGLPSALSHDGLSARVVDIIPPGKKVWQCNRVDATRSWPGKAESTLKDLSRGRKNSITATVSCLNHTASCSFFFCSTNITQNTDRILNVPFLMNVTDSKEIGRPETGRPDSTATNNGEKTVLDGFAYVNILDDESDIGEDHSACYSRVIIVARPTPHVRRELPAWVFIVASTAGLLLFALVVFVLCRCGFFKRETKDRMELLKTGAESHEKPLPSQVTTSTAATRSS